jgi:hypothetical protein
LPARLPPALIAGVVAKAEEDGKGEAEQREGRGRQLREPARRAGMQPGDRRRQHQDRDELRGDRGNDGTAQDEQQPEGAGAGT